MPFVNEFMTKEDMKFVAERRIQKTVATVISVELYV